MRSRARLGRLERCLKVRQGDCPGCRDRRGFVVLLQSRENEDGTVVPYDAEPESCARCCQVPERIVHIIEEVVNSHDEVAGLQERPA
jgi:hypothetical protein